MPDRLERLLNLTATLLDTRRPLTLEQIAQRLEPTYSEERVARRRQFERDKETLRELGIPISVEPLDALGGELGYRIRPSDYYLDDPGLTPEERAALQVAVSAVRLGDGDARGALDKLGGVDPAAVDPLLRLDLVPALPVLFDAVAQRAPVRFEYRGAQRELEPYGVVLRWGHWYVVGRDRARKAPRAFRIDRIEGRPSVGAAGSFEPPHGFDPTTYLRDDPLTFGEDHPVEALVLVDAIRAAWVAEQVGDEAVVERREDGAVVVRLSVVNREAFRTWVIGLLEHAEVLSPPELRADLVAWLAAGAQPAAPRRRRSRAR